MPLMTRTLKVLIAVLALSGLCAATALAADLDIAPKKADVGDLVVAHAKHVKKGKYSLFLVYDRRPTTNGACLRRIGERHKSEDGSVSFSGRIPKHIVCWENNSTKLGTIRTPAGRYHLVVAVQSGPAGYDTRFSFVRHKLRIVKSHDAEG
jgi:hypothetical protein